MSADPLADRSRERTPDSASETRLLEIRREAKRLGRIEEKGIRPLGAPFPVASPETGYYGIHLLKEPQWSAEIPLYFFTGGAAGSAAVIAAMADWIGKDPDLARRARWIAFGGALASSALLIRDLGKPERFLNMLRVFKVQSPMSVGAWTLAAFGGSSAASLFARAAERRLGNRFGVHVIGNLGQAFSALLGLPLHNYTGVLIGATTIPVWNKNIQTLPIHFGASGVQAGVSMLELMGHQDSRALNLLGIGSALWETWEGIHLETRADVELAPLKKGFSGAVTRTGGLMSGPAALVLRVLAAATRGSKSQKFRNAAAACGVIGSLLTRYGWIEAGHSSARDWRLPLEIPTEDRSSLPGAHHSDCIHDSWNAVEAEYDAQRAQPQQSTRPATGR
ncbi:MAG TPA: NrfD/PsrC family molybdoenzyme membrane anchor subunit [Candidatus Angelobacter sp.]|nr:NrfD/PsrC family molybdoenzyme membrane anchor subunit [Candidatus Angelobacter sp.]